MKNKRLKFDEQENQKNYYYANGGSIGFIPMDLEENLAIISKWGGTNIKGVIGFLNAMIDSGITDDDLIAKPTKNTRFQRERAEEKKIQEIWKKIEPQYKGGLTGNMYYSTIKRLVQRANSNDNILQKFKPFRKYQKDSFNKGGMILSNNEIIKDIDFSDNTDRRLGRYDFYFETEDSEGAAILDYDGYIIEAPSSSRRNDEIEWGQNTPEDWEKAEEILLNAFYDWKGKNNKFANGGGVGYESNEVLEYFNSLDWSLLPPKFADYVKTDILTDQNLKYLSPKEPIFIEIKDKIEAYDAVRKTSKTESNEQSKIEKEIADLKGLMDFVEGEELEKTNKEIEDLQGLLMVI